MWDYLTASILVTSHNSGEDWGNKPYTLKSTHKGWIITNHQHQWVMSCSTFDVSNEYIRNNQAILANILILSVSEKCLLACLVQVLFFIEHLATIKTRSTVLYESDNGVELDSFLKPTYMWLFIRHMLAAGKP